jgi:hypothetical protein
MKRYRIKEAGDMIASQPGPVLAQPTLIDLLAREIEKMNDSGAISPLIYARSRDLLPILRTSIMNIYGRRDSGLQQALAFLLKQARRGVE